MDPQSANAGNHFAIRVEVEHAVWTAVTIACHHSRTFTHFAIFETLVFFLNTQVVTYASVSVIITAVSNL
jgi:hypothetical protein